MTWRIVEITCRCKIETKLNYLVIRAEETKKIHLSEISMLIIENTAVSMTAVMLNELAKRNIKVIFCDEKRNPYGELALYHSSFDSPDCLRRQIGWSEDTADKVWASIVSQKICKQMEVLLKYGKTEAANLLSTYMGEILPGDASNREGHAAKVYFFSLFGNEYSRRDDNVINSCLNYGYSVLLSSFNREICINGYNTEIGIFHHNKFNMFNLASDLMEPFRPLVDDTVIGNIPDEFDSESKMRLANILNRKVIIDGQENYLSNAIRIYCRSFFDSMENNDPGALKKYEAEIHEDFGIL